MYGYPHERITRYFTTDLNSHLQESSLCVIPKRIIWQKENANVPNTWFHITDTDDNCNYFLNYECNDYSE